MSPQVLQLPEESCRSYQQVPLYCQHTGISESHKMAQGQLIHIGRNYDTSVAIINCIYQGFIMLTERLNILPIINTIFPNVKNNGFTVFNVYFIDLVC